MTQTQTPTKVRLGEIVSKYNSFYLNDGIFEIVTALRNEVLVRDTASGNCTVLSGSTLVELVVSSKECQSAN